MVRKKHNYPAAKRLKPSRKYILRNGWYCQKCGGEQPRGTDPFIHVVKEDNLSVEISICKACKDTLDD